VRKTAWLWIAGLALGLLTFSGCGASARPAVLYAVTPSPGCSAWYSGPDNGGPPLFTSSGWATQAAEIGTSSIRSDINSQVRSDRSMVADYPKVASYRRALRSDTNLRRRYKRCKLIVVKSSGI
jgi:hypothetical protein